MNIVCPNCGFSRNVSTTNLPPRAIMATCPKCAHRFKFRELSIPETSQSEVQGQPTGSESVLPPESPPTPSELPPSVPLQPAEPVRDDDLWQELAELGDGKQDDAENSDTTDSWPMTEPPTPTLPAWEQATSNYPRAFVQTIVDMFTNPRAFFQAMPVGHGLFKPLFFFLIITQCVAVALALWQLAGVLPPSTLTEEWGHNTQAALALILYPFQATIFLFLDAGINHLVLRLLKADSKGFEGTFRAEAYSTAPMLLMVIPFIGLPMAMIGMTVYKFLGLRHVHGASSKQILIVLFLPALLALAIAFVLTLVARGL